MTEAQASGDRPVSNMFARARGGPTVLRILLGAQLRRLREARSITRENAGYAIRASDSKISRLELGRVGFKERDVSDLLSLYGVHDEQERSALLSLALAGQRARLVAQLLRCAPELVRSLRRP
jgi:transcriptional regulator with XRE-family HTH domain